MWVVSAFYLLSAGWTLLSLALIFSYVIRINAAQEAYFASLTGVDGFFSLAIGGIGFSAAICLFLLRRVAVVLFSVAFHAADARPELDNAQQEASAGFRAAAGAGADEAVVFAWMEWPDRAARDKGMKLAMEDPRMQFGDAESTFAGNRLIACGFIPILQA